ncbi:MAG: methylmalonyl-CoA mutase small subunit, partial [Bacteroidales bacterium]|nr:methylmalonyl-CoA mutase small subunit [Bacteroidales bacterium]
VFNDENDFSQRLARNQQLVLRDEAHLDKVIDPAAGSYYIEKLTDSISREAWELFQELEADGGFVEAFLSGKIQDAITYVAQIRDERVSMRKEVLLGTNLYPYGLEELKDGVDMSRVHPQVVDPSGADAQPLIMYRGAEGFEKIRLQCERSKKRPRVFLLSTGDLTMQRARAGFASNFFACAGYEIIDNSGYENLEEGLVEALSQQADILVLCSSDEEYADLAPRVLASEFKGELVIAGYPKDLLEDLNKAGVKHFIHARSNVLQTLQHFNRLLGLND